MSFETDLAGLGPELRAYGRRVLGSPDVADDLVQETMVRALEKRGCFRSGTNLRAWAFTILRNLACDRGRRLQRRGPHVPLEGEDLPLASRPTQDQRLQQEDFGRRFRRLSPQQRWILLRVGPDGESHAAIAARLGISVGTVKSRVSRARARLRRLEAEQDGPAA